MRVKSDFYQHISRRTSLQTILLIFSQGLRAADLTADRSEGLAGLPLPKPGLLIPSSDTGGILAAHPSFFSGTAPFQGVTDFENACSGLPASLLASTPSPATAFNVGDPTLYPTFGTHATGWDFTITATAGNVSAGFSGSGNSGVPGPATDFCVRLNRLTGGESVTSVAIKTNDQSLAHLLSASLKLNLVPNLPSSTADISITGYKLGVAVPGATHTITGILTQTWTDFDVSAIAAFNGIDEFRFTTVATSPATVVSYMVADQISLPTVPLSLTLIAFSGRREGSDVLLNWTTSSEHNTSGFDIQRSTNGVNYATIGRISAAGNSTETLNYNYTDQPSLPSSGYFYRLKMTDLDGQFTYSAVVAIGAAPAAFSLSAYPNPCRGPLTITVETPVEGKALLSIRDINGKMLQTKNIVLQKGSNTVTLSSVARLGSGVYLLTVSADGQERSVRLVKAD